MHAERRISWETFLLNINSAWYSTLYFICHLSFVTCIMSPVTNIFLIVFVVAIVIIIIVIIVEFCWQKAPAFLESMTAPTNWPPAPSTNDGASRYYTDVRCHQTCTFSSIQNTSCGTPCEPWQRNIYLIEWSSPSPLNLSIMRVYHLLLHCTALHWSALHCKALHYTALYCTALHCAYVFFAGLF